MINENIPNGWGLSTLGEVCTQPQYGYTTSGVAVGTLKLLRTTDITSGAIDWNTVPFCLENPVDENKYLLKDGDIVISRAGSIGVSYLLKNPEKSVFASYLIRFRPLIDNHFFKYFLDSPYYWQQISENKLGIAIPNVNASKLQSISLLLPPLSEQKRIVAKIEELFSELESGIKSLKTAREQLKVYRQAVLKHAFEGTLTARWREQNKDKLESANRLLRRFQTYSSSNFAFNPREAADLPEIPSEWLYTRLENVGFLGRGKSKHRPRNDKKLFGGKYPFIQTGEIKAANRVVREFSQTYSDFGLQQSKLWPAGTLCITIAANIAETAFLGFDACFPDSIVGFTPVEDLILTEYVELFIKSVRARIEAYAPATAQKNINLTTLENLIIPFCSLEEQRVIVRQLEATFTRIDNCESEIEINLQKSEALRESILKKAFSGKLVTQDSNDEPASVLLERIRTEKETYLANNKSRHQKDVNSNDEYAQDYLIEEAAI